MNKERANILIELNTNFYKTVADSFSATRQSPWNGWRHLTQIVAQAFPPDKPLQILDLACGNLRFEEYFSSEFPNQIQKFHCYDNCDELALSSTLSEKVSYHNLDLATCLLEKNLDEKLGKTPCQVSVAFGFMHHLPTYQMRADVLKSLITHTEPKGIVAVSFWQFLNHENLAQKARQTTEKALQSEHLAPLARTLDKHDFFLGWKDTQDIYRYCHHFDSSELDALINEVADRTTILAQFSADGRNDALNYYIVFRVNG